VDDKNLRATNTSCTLAAQTGPIIVRQVIGEKEKQKVLDIHVVVPEQKPSIEQIVDVFVKDVDVHSVDVITDKVIVRGDFLVVLQIPLIVIQPAFH
jgi:acetolactate synthase small subunit